VKESKEQKIGGDKKKRKKRLVFKKFRSVTAVFLANQVFIFSERETTYEIHLTK
jgi:hypothetical protein